MPSMEKSERIQIRLNEETKKLLEERAMAEIRTLSATTGNLISEAVNLLPLNYKAKKGDRFFFDNGGGGLSTSEYDGAKWVIKKIK